MIVLGVTGGIACYKAVELVRLLVKADYRVQVIMTRGAMEFVTPLTFQTLSGNPVATDTFNLTQESEIGHINLADSADLFVIAPATANLIGKVANGEIDAVVLARAGLARLNRLEVVTEGTEQFLYVTGYQQLKNFAKLTLKGDQVWEKRAPMDSGIYPKDEDTKPTNRWGRDAFIALRGFMTLPDGLNVAREILLAWADAVSEGMLPNRFPDSGSLASRGQRDDRLSARSRQDEGRPAGHL